MKRKLAALSFWLIVLTAASLHSSVEFKGTIQAIFPSTHTVTIDQQNYQLLPDAKIYKDSNPGIHIPLNTQLIGHPVSFGIREIEDRGPMLLYLILLDE